MTGADCFKAELVVVLIALAATLGPTAIVFILPYFSLRFMTGLWPWPQLFDDPKK